MALNRNFIGRANDPGITYEVTQEKIRELAVATGDLHPAYLDLTVAQQLGYRDLIAPPSFAASLFFRFGAWPLYDPEFGKKKDPVCVLRSQRVVHCRPIVAGDFLTQTTVIDEMTEIGEHERWTSTHEIRTVEGELVCTVVNTVISRGTAGTERDAP
ncbi:MaoC family dehydratase [Paraburkholderia sp. ZP32-5]|uniref:MaoC family dehydratase n=1 Tax=Paraburkholderia sp. ZP32-5 TaxID=2883245 RepID=UPI001F2B90B1|nr:MaoC family dehydratase [Paraburkholderia sp. ZP32-5]